MTSKKPAQIYKLAFFKMGLLYLSTLFIVLSSIVVPGITQPKAYAQDYEGVFIDAVSVAVEGLGGDKKYASFVDDNPWGDGMGKGVNFQYTVAPSCNHEISGYDGGGSLKGDTDTLELDITVRKVNAAGQCITDHTGKVKLTEAKKAKITAYRLDNGTPDDRGDDIVFLPAYRVLTDNLPFTVQSALNGVFKRLPGDTVIEVDNCNVQTDCFVQFSGSRHDNIDTGGEWIQTVPPTHYYRRCATDAISQALVECEGRNVSLTFANNGDPISELPESYSGVDLATGGSDESGDAGAGGDSDDGQGTCEASGFSMAWIVCPVFNGLAELTDWIFRTLLDPFLTTPPVSTDPNSESFKVWSSFRVIGNIILVIGMLVIVFGQSLGGGLIDAYTAKKVFPRIIAAAILINLSVYFVAIAVDVSNILGKGIQQLMFAPFIATGASGFDLSGTQLAVMSTLLVGGGAGLIAGVAALGTAIFPLIGLFVVLPAVLIFIAILAVLILRQSLILFLVMISPIAFALYCLPNTEKYFKKWWEYLFKALLIYPIIAIMFALADIMAITVLAANGANSSNFLENGIAVIIAFIIQLVPLFVIPFSFKLAGGILGGLYGALNGFGKKSTEMVKGNANDQNSLRNRAKRGGNERLTRAQGKLIQPGRDVNAHVEEKR
jgi:MFS family permease